MSTLKRTLALALVFAFAFTMMAGATVFTDDSSIEAQDQVDLIYALGIMKGYPDGSFGAEKTITRAEAAKMMYVIKTGKDSGSDNYKNAANPFTDVSSDHWAKGYINYCYLNGIIAGVGGGKFNPEGQVTGAQLAKMLLAVIGYDATKAALTGDQWLISTMSLAFEHDLFDDYSAEVSSAAPREDAAIIFYNTIYALTVSYRDDEYVTYDLLGNDNKTVGEKNFNLTEYEGLLIAAEKLNAVSGISAAKETIILDVDCDTTYDTFGAAAGTWDDTDDDVSLEYDGGLEYLGQYVKVLYDDNKDVVYNIVSADDNVVYDTYDGAITDGATVGTTIEYNDDQYNYKSGAAGTKAFVNNEASIGYDIDSTSKTYDPVKLVDYNGDDTIDFAFITSYTFGYVSALDSKSIDFGEGGKKFIVDDETYVHADGIEEEDYVLYYYDELKDCWNVKAATATSGTVGGTRGTDVKFDGSYIARSTKAFDAGVAVVVEDADPSLPDVGDSYTVYTDGKYYLGFVSGEESIAGSGNYCYVVEALNESAGLGGNDPKVSVYIPGEDDTVDYVLDDDSTCYNAAGTAQTDVITTAITGSTVDATHTGLEGKLFAYKIQSNGSIKLSQDFSKYDSSADISYNEDTDVFTVSNTAGGSDGGYLLSSDAVIFYQTRTWDGAAQATSWEIYGAGDFDDSFNADDDQCVFAYKSSGGFKYITGAVILTAEAVTASDDADILPAQSGTASDRYYGYALSAHMIGYDKTADEDYYEYDLWTNGAEDYLKEIDGSTTVAKRDFISYVLNSDGDIKEDSIRVNEGLKGAITAYNSSKNMITITYDTETVATDDASTDDVDESFVTTTEIYTITEDTVINYIDDDNCAGDTGSSFPKISSADLDDQIGNVYFVEDVANPGELLYICVDTSSNFDINR